LEASGECGVFVHPAFVVGGETAKPGEFPFDALLGYFVPSRERVFYSCGGALINKYS